MVKLGTGALVVAVLAVGLVALVALGSNSTVVSVSDQVALGDPMDVDPAVALITDKYEDGGFSLLGLKLTSPDYRLRVRLFTAAGCFILIENGEPWPTSFEECSSPIPIEGAISGGGIAATGASIVGVDLLVDRDCFDAVEPGDPWPPSSHACSEFIPG